MSLMTMAPFLAQAGEIVGNQPRMTAFSWAFMLISMGSVIWLTIWCFSRILRGKRHFDPDGTGPEKPPVTGSVEGQTP